YSRVLMTRKNATTLPPESPRIYEALLVPRSPNAAISAARSRNFLHGRGLRAAPHAAWARSAPRSGARRLLLRGLRLGALHLNRAVLQQRDQRRNRRHDRCEHGAHDARGQRKLRDDAPVVAHDDAAHVALVDHVLELLDDRFAFTLDRLPPC